jgi:hypothetical protein
MNSSATIHRSREITLRPLAPVIPMKSVASENVKPKRKISKTKSEVGMPLFYNKPIYKSRKYDLL